MDRAAGVLARAWYDAWRGWWLASALALSGVLVLVLATAGLLEGMERETEQRVADFYTGDLRVTPERAGAAPPGSFGFNTSAGLELARAGLEGAAGRGARVEARLETTYLLSRRGLVEAYLFEDDQFGVALPGVASERDAYSVGVLAGLPMADAATRDRLRPYLVTGSFPEAAENDTGPVQVLMSTAQFASMLDEGERERIGARPTAGELSALRLEITAARVDDSGPFKDIIRYPARVTGVFDSGLDALDRITLVAPIEDARRLLGADADSGEANVFTVHGGAGGVAHAAEQEGWVSEGPAKFTQRYLGQLVAVVRILGLALSSLLLSFPFFMVWVGMAQQLDRSRRELAVCRAIGMGPATVRGALLRLTARVALLSVGPTVVVIGLAAWLLPRALGPAIDFPFPLGFVVPAWAVAVCVATLLLAGGAALGGAMRRHNREDLAGTLRAL
ncbi:MAG: FtsX-like permease family protein [Candidatus Thermoplasmatota archaeon]